MRTTRLSVAFAIALLVSVAGCRQTPAPPTDQQITASVQARLQAESALAGQNIQASVDHGVVTLSGTAADAASRALAGNDAGSVTGVKTVVNNLEVQPAPTTAAVETPAPAEARPVRERPVERRRDVRRSKPAEKKMAENIPPPPPPDQPAPVVAKTTPPPPPPPPQPVVKTFVFPAGTAVPVRLSELLDTKTAQPNDTFHATLAADLVRDGVVVVPRGTPVLGQVVDVRDAGRFRGSALLALQLVNIDYRGRRMSVMTNTFSREGKARGKNTAEKVGGGAILGAVIGAIAGGGKGAAIGTLAGAGAGAGANAVTRGEQIQLPPETMIHFVLQQPLSVTRTIMPGSNEPVARQPYQPGFSQRPQQ